MLLFDFSECGVVLIIDEVFGEMYLEVSFVGVVVYYLYFVVLKFFGKFFGFVGVWFFFVIVGEDYVVLFEVGLGLWFVLGLVLVLV